MISIEHSFAKGMDVLFSALLGFHQNKLSVCFLYLRVASCGHIIIVNHPLGGKVLYLNALWQEPYKSVVGRKEGQEGINQLKPHVFCAAE